jgi:hypothetical protein
MKRKTPNLNPDKTCFFICPIDKEGSVTRQRSDQVLQFIVAPAIAKHDLVTIRADQIADPGSIPNQIITHILHDKLVIADLTDHNPNVFYEVALRHAFRKPIIQIIEAGQTAPFDVGIMRTVPYALDLLSATTAKNDIERFVETVLDESYEVESPVTIAAKIEDLTRSRSPESQVIIQSILANIESLSQKLDHISGCVCRTDDLRDSIPPLIKDRVESILGQYSAEIGLLKSLRHAGITGIFKRREMALAAFARALDEESREIMIIGSSLKGLLQKEEYKAIANKIKFKADKKLTNVKFLLTHPIVADFRASQENRRPGEIGKEILASLCILRDWQIPPENVRLYLGTPTCFAIAVPPPRIFLRRWDGKAGIFFRRVQ